METNDKKLYLVNGLSPAFPVHPGSVLGEELEVRGIKRKDFAKLSAGHDQSLEPVSIK